MMYKKKYLSKALLSAVLCCFFTIKGSAQTHKAFQSFDIENVKLDLIGGRFSLSTNKYSTGGVYRKVNNEYFFYDTLFNVNKIICPFTLSNQSSNNEWLSVKVKKDMRLTPIAILFKNGSINNFQFFNDSILINKASIDSFYISFIGLESRSETYAMKNINDYNTLVITIPDNVFYSISIGEEIGYETMAGNKINIHYFINGVKQQKYLYLSRKDLKQDYNNRLKIFDKTGYWTN